MPMTPAHERGAKRRLMLNGARCSTGQAMPLLLNSMRTLDPLQDGGNGVTAVRLLHQHVVYGSANLE